MARAYTLTDENDRERYAKEACRFIASLQPVEQGRYYAQLARKTGYPVEALQAQGASGSPLEAAPLQRQIRGRRPVRSAEEENLRVRAENALLQAMSQSKDATMTAVSEGALELFSGEARSALAAEIIAAYAQEAPPNCARIVAAMPAEYAEQLAGVFREDTPLTDPVRAVQDCIGRIRRFDCRQQVEALTLRLSDSTLAPQERQALMQQIQNLTRQLRG